ncbi:hypothetical protein GCM10018952_47380 [Streptosporangium vulgare]
MDGSGSKDGGGLHEDSIRTARGVRNDNRPRRPRGQPSTVSATTTAHDVRDDEGAGRATCPDQATRRLPRYHDGRTRPGGTPSDRPLRA